MKECFNSVTKVNFIGKFWVEPLFDRLFRIFELIVKQTPNCGLLEHNRLIGIPAARTHEINGLQCGSMKINC